MPATMSPVSATTTVTKQQIEDYRRDGFLVTRGVLNAEEVTSLRERFTAAAAKGQNHARSYGKGVFDQFVNLWQTDDRSLLDLALHANMRAIATDLAGVPLRLWHDHLLVKRARNGVATEFHQDQPYWPHLDASQALSAWVALVDVPVERGCMSYIAGSHRYTDLAVQNLHDSRSLFERCPEMEWKPTTTVPVRAGDVVWHHARTAHRAGANDTDQDRVAVSVIYMPRSTRFDGKIHCCTQGKDYAVGDLIAGDDFPEA